MRNLFYFIILALFTLSAFARRYERPSFDQKFPSQKVIEKISWSDVLAANGSTILADVDGPTSGSSVSVTTGLGSLDFPRNLTIQPGGTTADVGSCTITVSGTDYNNDAISENFSFSANQTTAETGAKAFRSVTSVAFAASCEDSPYSAIWSVGRGEILGLSRCMDDAADWLIASVDGVKESTAPTITINNTIIESNTIDFNTAFDGSKDFKFYFMQSYGCD